MAIIAGEEAAGEGGFVLGASATTPFSGGCGAAFWACIGVGGIVGAVGGDMMGGYMAGRGFDKLAEDMAPGEIERIKQLIREDRLDDSRIVVEDPSTAGGL